METRLVGPRDSKRQNLAATRKLSTRNSQEGLPDAESRRHYVDFWIAVVESVGENSTVAAREP